MSHALQNTQQSNDDI